MWTVALLGTLFLVGGQTAFWANYIYNRAIWKKFEARYGQIYWFDFCDSPQVRSFVQKLSSLETEARELLGKYGGKRVSEPLYCFIMKEGEVSWQDKKAKGLQRDNWLKIEWRGEDVSFKLARHELMHYLLSRILPRSTTEQQHEIMEQCMK